MTMRIRRIDIAQCGPLQNITWEPEKAAVVYDSNEEGKTALADALICSMFGIREFPGADRFGSDVQAQVTVERDGKELAFPRSSQPRTLTDLLEWPEKQLARLFCVRGGELELASRREVFSRLTDGLTDLLSGVGGKLDRVQQKVRDAAHLTGGGDWTDKEGHRVKREVQSNLEELRKFSNALPQALELEEKQRDYCEKEAGKQGIEANLQQVRKELEGIEYQQRVRLYHEGQKLYLDRETLRRQIEQDYARYREEELRAWEQAENQLTTAGKLNVSVKELVELDRKIGEGESNLSRLRTERKEAEGRIQQERSGFRDRVQEMRGQLAGYENIRRSVEKREAIQRMLPWGSGVSALLSVIFFAAALLKSLTAAWVLGGILFAVSAWGLRVFLKWHSEKVRLSKQEDDLRTNWRNAGVSIHTGKGLDEALQEWEQAHDEALEQKLKQAYKPENAARSDLEGLQSARQVQEDAAKGHVDDLKKQGREIALQLDDSEACSKQVQTLVSELENTIHELRDRSGLPTHDELKTKVNERRELQQEKEKKESELCGKLGVQSFEAAQPKLSRLEKGLREGERDESALESIPTTQQLEEKRQVLQQKESRLNEEVDKLNRTLKNLADKLEDLQGQLVGLRIRTAADVYAGMEEARNILRQRVTERLAGIWTLNTLEKVQGSYKELLDSSLRKGESTASEIFRSITGRYDHIRFDAEQQTFVAMQEDGMEYPENKLSDGARKQLLFALRVSFLQRVLGEEKAFLVLDDPFITFDDEGRKERAVRWLADLIGQGWQVLYFTADITTRELFAEHLQVKPYRVAQLCR